MIQVFASSQMGKSHLGWLKSHFHFSFAEYYNPANIHFGALRVINDDQIAPHSGFDTHPHKDMEIITYVIEGELTHRDSMGNGSTLTRGQVQYMSAGTGITHSEFNHGDLELRLLQIWIFPDRKGHVPQYGEIRPAWEERVEKWLPLNTGIHQDAKLFASWIPATSEIRFPVQEGRQAYLVQIEGESSVNGHSLNRRDALTTQGESLVIQAKSNSHFLIIELAQ